MKTNKIISGIVIALISFTAYGFINKPKSTEKESVCSEKTENLKSVNEIFTILKTEKLEKVFYSINGAYKQSITKRELVRANFLSDFVEHYPSSWIKDYILVETTIVYKNKETKIISSNVVLNKEQKAIFSSINISTDINFKIKYNKKSDKVIPESREINFSMRVIPEQEAKYKNGYGQLLNYLENSKFSKMYLEKIKEFEKFEVHFTINQNGTAENVRLIKKTGDKEMDKLLLNLIYKMPKWSPAKNADGEFVSQEFELNNSMKC